MEYLKIKNSDLIVSRLCMGGCPMGGYGWGNVRESELLEAVSEAISHGVTMFDTADIYGLGNSERILGEALKDVRKSVIIATKFGVRIKDGKTFYDNSPTYVEKACDESLKRLKTDYIDLYQIHYRDGVTPLEDVIEILEKLKKIGKIRYYGLSNIQLSDVNELNKYKKYFISFQDEYSLACRKNEEDIFKLAKNLELTPLTWGSLGQGILTGKYDKDCQFSSDDRRSREIYVNFHGEKLVKNLEIVETLKEIAQEVNKPVSAVAIRFILDYISESVVLAGIKNPKQLKGNCKAFGWNLSQKQIMQLEKISR